MALGEADLTRIPDRGTGTARARPRRNRKVIDLTDGHEPRVLGRNGRPLPSTAPDECALVEASRDGDWEAYAGLYARYRRRLFKSCYKWTRDRSASDDLVQDTFVRAFTCLEGFRAGEPFLPWLQSIARNRWIDMQRREERHPRLSLERMVEEGDNELSSSTVGGVEDPAWEATIRADDQARLQALLKDLTPRQQRVLLLFGLEDWSYRDIATAEGMTVEATKSMLFRARASVLRAQRKGALGILLFPIESLRQVMHRAGDRVRRAVETPGFVEASSTVGVQSIAAGILALVISATSLTGATPGDLEVATESSASVPAAAGPGTSPEDGVAAGSVAPAGNGDGEEGLTRAVSEVLDPNQSVEDPEDTQVRSVVFSPNYEADGTIFMVGMKMPCPVTCPPVLFRSTDGGGTWTRLPADGLQGDGLLLPPAYGRGDDRIFVMGGAGLQMSNDGGRSFTVVTPAAAVVLGSAAMPPSFSDGDARIVIGADTLIEYRDDIKAFTPAPYSSIPGPLEPAFSPNYSHDGLMVIGGTRYSPYHGKAGMLFRCTTSLCEEIILGGSLPQVRFAHDFERNQTVFAFTSGRLFVSRDEARSFEQLPLSFEAATVTEVAVSSDGSVYAAIFGVGDDALSGVLVSRDLGRSWTMLTDPLLDGGVRSLAVRGTLLVAGGFNSMACSADAGVTWHRRCPAF